MSLQIIYGKSGTGKSEYIFKKIAEKIESGINRKIYIITPEQFSFTAEKKLLDSIGKNAVTNAEVLTFGRMAYRVIQEKKRATARVLSSCGKSMIIYDILSEKKNDLCFIGKSKENVDLISTQVTEFKKHGITIDILKETIEKTEDIYLKTKLKDMLLVYEEYDNKITDNYIDENDSLSILLEELEDVSDFKNCDIYIDEFVGFTKQEYEIIRLLLRNNNDIFMTVCTDEIDISTTPDTDVFYANKQTLDKVFEIAKQENVSILNPICMEKSYRFKNEELQHLEQNIYAVPYQKYEEQVENIELLIANNQYSEVEQLGEKIVTLVKKQGYRYNEISVITKDLENYANLCKAIFSKYHIPVFIDEKKDLSQNILVRYILAVLHIFANNWSYEAVFEYIKTGFLTIDTMDILILENYCLRWGIKGSKWYIGEWQFYEETEEEKQKILHIRQLLIEPLLELKGKLVGQKSVKDITVQLYQFLIDNQIDVKLEQKILELQELGEVEKAQEYETSWKIVIGVLDEIVSVLGEKKVSFEKYADILKMGLGSSGLGKIPASQDQVVVGDVDRSRSHRVRAVFIIGLNDGVLPSNHKDEGFFNDNDREILKTKGAELAKGTLEKLYDDNFNIYKAFSTAEEKLYLSYASSDLEGKQLRPSILVNKIKKIFPKLKEKSDIIAKQSNELLEIVNEERSFEELLDKLRQWKDERDLKVEDILPWAVLYDYFMSSQQWKNKILSIM